MVEPFSKAKNSTNRRLKDDELSFDHVELEINRTQIYEIAYMSNLYFV